MSDSEKIEDTSGADENMTEVLNGIDGALESAQRGLEQIRNGLRLPLAELEG